MNIERQRELTAQFKEESSDRASEIDPENGLHWFDLTVGWAIAKGLNGEEAHKFAQHIRYHTDLA